MNSEITNDVAIIGMSGRFPGAKDLEELWKLLCEGREGLTHYSEAELAAAGIEPEMLRNPKYVRVHGSIADVENFDASFFGFTPREAEITDPQQRIFLEHAWAALESAGYCPENYQGSISVYAGASGGSDTYLISNLLPNHALRKAVGDFHLFIANDKDSLATRVSYKLNLRGPSITVQTACSTSLVAVCMAYHSLLSYQCDMALAGGIAVSVPYKTGYLYEEGMIFSPDGHCRAFDDQAQGTVPSNGVGVVVLKRLEDAIADGDSIYAVIKGVALNNDGSGKAGYTAPGVNGQAEVIAQALAASGLSAESISYIETHGTATPIGDPIEIAALSQAFRNSTQRKGFCALGSIKTNLGHTNTAAGVAGLIKTVLSLQHGKLPPSLHFTEANSKIDFANSPFYVQKELAEWDGHHQPRRAGVSAFGVGGTNAHVILEEAPPIGHADLSRDSQLLVLSARSDTALDKATARLVEYLRQHPDANLADIAYTLQVGRRSFEQRRAVVCNSVAGAIESFSSQDPGVRFSDCKWPDGELVVFMFSGQGSEYLNMGAELYREVPVFREHLDRCCDLLRPHLGLDLRHLIYPSPQQESKAAAQLQRISIAMPALFAVEYALARLWMAWGVRPGAMFGVSIGEYVAACLAEVFSLEDALTLVSCRGALMESTQPGGMLAVSMTEGELRSRLTDELTISVVLPPKNCVVSGPLAAIDTLQIKLIEQGIECQRVPIRVAPHSPLMEPILSAFLDKVRKVKLHAPQIPYLSNVTGTWVTATQTTDPQYWVQHLRNTVRLTGLPDLLKESRSILIEVGPGRGLSSAIKRHPARTNSQVLLSSMRHPNTAQSDIAYLQATLGRAWAAGATVNWVKFNEPTKRRRLALPTYPFERQRYFIEPSKHAVSQKDAQPIASFETVRQAGLFRAQSEHEMKQAQEYLKPSDLINRLSAAYVNLALSQLQAFSTPVPKTLQQLLIDSHIQPRYEQLLYRCLNTQAEYGFLTKDGEIWRDFLPFPAEDLPALIAEVRAACSNQESWVDMVMRCGSRYAGILTGEESALELLFGESFFKKLRTLYRESPVARYLYAIIQAMLASVVNSMPAMRRLRILEVGAGTGATTSNLLPVLPPQRAEYTFTDIGRFFVSHASEQFSEYPFLRYALLDIDRDPLQQGYAEHSYDIVVAANVLHATRNLGKALQHVRSLLAPGGFLFLLEATQYQVSFDVGLPLLQPFDPDDLRAGAPFLSADTWKEVLTQNGFSSVAVLPDQIHLETAVFVAQAASEEAIMPLPLSMQTSQTFTLMPSLRPKLSTPHVAPRTELEKMIAEVWQDALGIDLVGIHDNFFELGGDSLLAVNVVAQLRNALHVELSPASLLEHLTVAAFAEHVVGLLSFPTQSEQVVTVHAPLVRLRDGSMKQPFHLFHAAGGHAYMYYQLSRSLRVDIPVYAAQSQGIDGEQEPLDTLEAMARQYAEAIRTLQPEGPYFLGGACMGGVLAYETARQLRASGLDVALLAMFDAFVPSQSYLGAVDDAGIWAAMLDIEFDNEDVLEPLRKMSPDEQPAFVRAKAKAIHQDLPNLSDKQLWRLFRVYKTSLYAYLNYIPEAYPGHITLFHAIDDPRRDIKNRQDAWAKLVTGIEAYEIPGTHSSILLEPHVDALSEHLVGCINRARAAYRI